MSFRIYGLDPAAFAHLQALDARQMRDAGARRVAVTARGAAPCRISLDDAEPGEEVLLVSHLHQPADTPYRQQGPIFVRAGVARFDATDIVPPALARRPLSLRGYDSAGMMVEALLCDGSGAAAAIEGLFADRNVDCIHAHYARRGCFAAAIVRA